MPKIISDHATIPRRTAVPSSTDAIRLELEPDYSDALTFQDLAKRVAPKWTGVSPVWTKHINRSQQTCLFYQLNLDTCPPSMSKSILLEYRSFDLPSAGLMSVLIPRVFVGEREVPRARVKQMLGKSFIVVVTDLTFLLEFVDESSLGQIFGTEQAVLDLPDIVVIPPARFAENRQSVDRSSTTAYGVSEDEEETSEDDDDGSVFETPSHSTDPDTVSGLTVDSMSLISEQSSEYFPQSVRRRLNIKGRQPLATRTRSKPRPKTSGDLPAKTTAAAAPLWKKATPTRARTSAGVKSPFSRGPHRRVADPNSGSIMMDRIKLYRQMAAKELKQDVNSELKTMSVKQVGKLRTDFRRAAGIKDSVWGVRIAEARFGTRSLAVWKQFCAMYEAFKKVPGTMDAIVMIWFRDFLAKESDKEVIRIMKECTDQKAVDPLRSEYLKWKSLQNSAPKNRPLSRLSRSDSVYTFDSMDDDDNGRPATSAGAR